MGISPGKVPGAAGSYAVGSTVQMDHNYCLNWILAGEISLQAYNEGSSP